VFGFYQDVSILQGGQFVFGDQRNTLDSEVVVNQVEPSVQDEPRDLRDWQEDVLSVFKAAILPATKYIYHTMKTHMDLGEKELDDLLAGYYRSSAQRKVLRNEIVWGQTRIEELLLSPIICDKRFLRAQFQAATGSGKTRVLSEMILAHAESDVRVNPNKKPVYLITEPNLNLVQQTYESLSKIKTFDCFCVCSSKEVPNKSKVGAVASMQNPFRPTIVITTTSSAAGTYDNKGLMCLLSEKGVNVDMLFIDEAHLVAGESKGKITKETYLDYSDVAMLKISFTATPNALSKPENVSNGFSTPSQESPSDTFLCQNDVKGVFGPAMCKYTYKDALTDEVVLPLRLNLLNNAITSSSSIRNHLGTLVEKWDAWNVARGNDFSEMQGSTFEDPLDASTEKQRPMEMTEWKLQRMLMMLKVWYEFATGKQTHVVAYCSKKIARAVNLRNLMTFLCEEEIRDIEAGSSIFGFQKNSQEHSRIQTLSSNCFVNASNGLNGLDPFKSSEMGFLTNIATVSVGTDIPQLTGIFFADIHAIENELKMIQTVGRGTRISDGKENCEIFLPCFVTSPNSSQTKDIPPETLSQLERLKKQNNWAGSFSKMAIHIQEYLRTSRPNEKEMPYLGVCFVKSCDIFTRPVQPKQIAEVSSRSTMSRSNLLRQHRYGKTGDHDVTIL
jgi:hypothetical protein